MSRFPQEPLRLVETNDPAGRLLRKSLAEYAAGLDGQRAWSGALTKPRRTLWRWHLAIAGFVCAGALAFFVATAGQERGDPVPTPSVTARGPIIQPLPSGVDVAPTSTAQTQPPARAEGRSKHRIVRTVVLRSRPLALGAGEEVALADGTRVRLAPGGQASASAPDRDRMVIALSRGAVGVTVTKRRPGERFEVQAGPYTFRVVGTRFTVESSGGGARLAVSEGVVLVVGKRDRELGRITAGGTWSSDGAPPAAREVVLPQPAPVALEPIGVGEPAEREPPPSLPPAQQQQPSFPEPPPQRARVPASSECLAQARTGAAREAAECLEAAAARPGLDGEIALVELARLRRDALNDPKGSLAALSDYGARFPEGALREEALAASIDLLVRTGDGPGALAESERLLRRIGSQQRRAEIHLLRGNVLRVLEGDCRRADAEYAAAGGSGAERVVDDAAFWRAVCLASLGERAAATQAFTQYLERPRAQHAADAKARLESLRR